MPLPNLYSLNASGFPQCCGAVILHGFAYASEDTESADVEERDNLRVSLLRYIKNYRRYAFIIVILNEYQETEFNDILEELDFKKLSSARGREKAMLHLYSCTPPYSLKDFENKYRKFLGNK